MEIFKKISFFVFLILSIRNVYAADWEYWSKYSLSKKLIEKVDLKIEQEFRMKSNFGHFYYYRNYLGPVFKVTKFLKISPLYSYKTSENKKDWSNEDMGNFDIELIPPPFCLNLF